MAVDIYLQLDGIKGESTDDGHKEWLGRQLKTDSKFLFASRKTFYTERIFQKSKNILLLYAASILVTTMNAQANNLGPNTYLYLGQSIQSLEKKYTLIMQTDGSLVMYRQDGSKRYGMAKYGSFAVMQSDGNFVEYGGSKPLWYTGTQGNPNASLFIQDDGNLVVYSATGVPLWNIGAEPTQDDPSKVADIVGRDLKVSGLEPLGHIGIWDGTKVFEVAGDGYNAIRTSTINQFKTETSYWGKASSNIPTELVTVDCGLAYCPYRTNQNSFDVYARQAAVRRAYQVYLIGSDYTKTTYVTSAIAGSEYYPPKRGSYRCDTYVLDALRRSTNARYAAPNYNSAYPTSAAMQTWRSRVNSLYTGVFAPRPIFDRLRTFQ